jgi:hypothetical protein
MAFKRNNPEKILARYTPRRTKRGDAFLERASKALNDDEARFKWMLHLLELDIDQLPASGIAELYREAWFIIDRGEGRGFADAKLKIRPSEYEMWKRVKQDVGAFLTEIATGNFHIYKIEAFPDAPGTVNRNAAFRFGEEWQWVFFRQDRRLVRRFSGTLPTTLLLTAADLLEQIGSHRLKICPLNVHGACRRLFLARRAQKFCSRQHAARAAWDRWLHRHHGGTRGK